MALTMMDVNCYCLGCSAPLFYGGYTRGNFNSTVRGESRSVFFIFEDRMVENSFFKRDESVLCRCSRVLGAVHSTPETDAYYMHTNMHFFAINGDSFKRHYIGRNERIRELLRNNYRLVMVRSDGGQNAPRFRVVAVAVDEGGALIPAFISAAGRGGESSRTAGNLSVPLQVEDNAIDPTGRRYVEVPLATGAPSSDDVIEISSDDSSVSSFESGDYPADIVMDLEDD